MAFMNYLVRVINKNKRLALVHCENDNPLVHLIKIPRWLIKFMVFPLQTALSFFISSGNEIYDLTLKHFASRLLIKIADLHVVHFAKL